MFMTIADGRSKASSAAPISLAVSGVSAAQMTTMSASGSNWCSAVDGCTSAIALPASPGPSSGRRRVAMTLTPNALARVATRVPIAPSPITSIVCPASVSPRTSAAQVCAS